MLFNSIDFFWFFIAVWFIYWILPHQFRWVLLLAASVWFYMYFIPVYVLILLLLIVIDYTCALQIASGKKPLLYLRFSLISNLLILAFFKYWNFLNENLLLLLKNFSYQNPLPFLKIALPVGLSFHTFQSMAYTVDVYKGRVKAERHFGIYSLFVLFFPQLVAGPIERASNLLHQLKNKVCTFRYQDFVHGFSLMCRGFFKKVVVADQLSVFVDAVYDNYTVNHGFTVVLATWFFALRIYCDFSGYSDIAIGAARLLGIELSLNFNLPYFSKSITEFWRRWHISLSLWLRDYLYIPLGGNRISKFRTSLNNMITMLLGGLWHGASWNFVIWGGINGLYLGAEKATGTTVFKTSNPFLKALKVFLVFNLICFAWIFFRAQTFHQSVEIIKSIPTDFFSLSIKDSGVFINCLFSAAVLLICDYFIFRKFSINKLINEARYKTLFAMNLAFIVLVILFSVSSGAQFIYFQF